MSKVAVFTAVKSILEGLTFPLPPFPSTTSGSFALVTIGERKDYANQTPLAVLMDGKTVAEQQALPQKWNHMSEVVIIVYIAYSDQNTAELTRLSVCDAILNLFEQRRRLGGAADVIDSFPYDWDPGYTEIGGTEYLSATCVLRVWEQTDQPITP